MISRINLNKLVLTITLFLRGIFFKDSCNLYPRRGRGSLRTVGRGPKIWSFCGRPLFLSVFANFLYLQLISEIDEYLWDKAFIIPNIVRLLRGCISINNTPLHSLIVSRCYINQELLQDVPRAEVIADKGAWDHIHQIWFFKYYNPLQIDKTLRNYALDHVNVLSKSITLPPVCSVPVQTSRHWLQCSATSNQKRNSVHQFSSRSLVKPRPKSWTVINDLFT